MAISRRVRTGTEGGETLTLSDELRALAEEIACVDVLVSSGTYARLCALADRLQGMVVAKPFAENCGKDCDGQGMWHVRLGDDPYSPPSGWGTTEAEAVSALQSLLDAAERGDG